MSRISSTINRGTQFKSVQSASKYLGSPYLINSLNIENIKRNDPLQSHKFPDFDTFKQSLSISLGCDSTEELELIKSLQSEIRYLIEENSYLKSRSSCEFKSTSSDNHTVSLQSVNSSVRLLESELVKAIRDLNILQDEIKIRTDIAGHEKKHYDECHQHFHDDIKHLKSENEVLQQELVKRLLKRDALYSEVNTIIGKCCAQKCQQNILREQLHKRIVANNELNVNLAQAKSVQARKETDGVTESKNTNNSASNAEDDYDSVRESSVYLKGQIAYTKRLLQQKSIYNETEKAYLNSLESKIETLQSQNNTLEKKKNTLKSDLKHYEKLKISEDVLEKLQNVNNEESGEDQVNEDHASFLQMCELKRKLELLKFDKTRWQRELDLNRQFRIQFEASKEVVKEADDQLTSREDVSKYTEIESAYKSEQDKYYEVKRSGDRLNETLCQLNRQIHYLDQKADSFDCARLNLENRLRKLMQANQRHENQHHRDWKKAEKLAGLSVQHAHHRHNHHLYPKN